MEQGLKDQIADFIKNHPGLSYSEFKKISKLKISDGYYYSIRKTVYPDKKRAYHRSSSNIFINLISIPVTGMTEQTKGTIAEVIKAINFVKRTRIEIIENTQNKTLEFRESGL